MKFKKIPKEPFVSIIVPLHWGLKKENYNRVIGDLKLYLNLDYDKYEILLVTDKKIKIPIFSSKIIYLVTKSAHPTSPAEKRDFALPYAKGSICAFIDDDAYPDPYWLNKAVPHFKNNKIGAVGGPGLTPPTDSFWEKLGGYVYESFVTSGGAQSRVVSLKRQYVEDWPAYNLIIRTDLLRKIGGWDSKYYGGEDTKLCISIIKTGAKIMYEPKVIVYHHRRPLFLPHLRQIANVGLHRGYFVKAYPRTSLHWIYFVPSTLTLGFFSGLITSLIRRELMLPFMLSFSIFFLIGILSVVKRAGIIKAFLVAIGIILTHITYGIYFISGLLTRKLEI